VQLLQSRFDGRAGSQTHELGAKELLHRLSWQRRTCSQLVT
jgi:hypothetical protein